MKTVKIKATAMHDMMKNIGAFHLSAKNCNQKWAKLNLQVNLFFLHC